MADYCEYTFTMRGDAADRVRRKYKRLVGRNAPPIDIVKFRRDKLHSRTYRFKDGKLVTTVNGLNVNRAYHFDSDPVGIIISVDKYSNSGQHIGHAISAVKYGKTLFAFNAWGRYGYDFDSTIFKTVADMYRCTKVIRYEGPNLQAKNRVGVCVAFASNYVAEMFLKIAANKFPKTISKSKFNEFVNTVLRERGVCFGTRCEDDIKLGTAPKIMKMYADLTRSAKTPDNLSKLDTMKVVNLHTLASKFNITHTGIKKSELIKKLKKYFSGASNVKFRSISVAKYPAKAPALEQNFRTLANARAYAKRRCIKGRSLRRRKADLVAHIRASDRSPPKSASPGSIESMKAQELRDYARDRCVPGYSKYPKKVNLKNFLIRKKYV